MQQQVDDVVQQALVSADADQGHDRVARKQRIGDRHHLEDTVLYQLEVSLADHTRQDAEAAGHLSEGHPPVLLKGKDDARVGVVQRVPGFRPLFSHRLRVQTMSCGSGAGMIVP